MKAILLSIAMVLAQIGQPQQPRTTIFQRIFAPAKLEDRRQVPPQDTVTLVFIGDVMSHSTQLEPALKPGGNINRPQDFDYSSYFQYVKPRFDAADYVVANMEFPVGITPYSGYPQFSAPQSLAYEAQNSGIDLFLTANNHICDQGRAGMDSTYSVYSRMGVDFTGFFRSEGEEHAKNPLIVDVKGVKIAFINFTYDTNGIPIPKPYIVGLLDTVQVGRAISRARERGADFIIALPHWGLEYHLDYSPEQKRWVDWLYSNGVDAIIGGHPHVVQKAEFDSVHATVYSLGNYISNMKDTNTQIGMLYQMTIVKDRGGKTRIIDAFPTYTWCSRKGRLERNYTVIPIEEWIGTRNKWIDKSEYDKMVREWTALKKKFAIE